MSEADPPDIVGDASARRHAEVQYAVSRVLARARSTDDAFANLVQSISAALDWDYSGVWLIDAQGAHMIRTHQWAADDLGLKAFVEAGCGLQADRGVGLIGRVWETARPHWLRDAFRMSDFSRRRAAHLAGLADGMAFPVQSSAGVVAVVECFTRVIESPDRDLMRLTEALGHQIGLFLDRRAAEQLLEENEARYAAIVHGTIDAVVMIDEAGLITEFNPAAERLFGYVRADAVGRELANFMIPAEVRDELRRLRETGESHILDRRLELTARHRDGGEFPAELTVSRFPVSGRAAYIGFMRDITERRRQEEERESLLAAEQTARREAITASGLKDEFLAALSHELRTPLNAVLGWTRMLVTRTVTADRVDAALQTIFRNAEAQKRIVDDLLDISAFVQGQMRMEFARLNLAEVVDGAWQAVRPTSEVKGLRVALDVPATFVRADRMRLQQVFWNLMSNAVKFTPAGGQITVCGGSRESFATVAVSDDGAGIDAAFLPHVFDRFRQGDGVHSAAGGLGLGLSLVRQIVEAHGGIVTASSEGAGRGAAFTVELPLADGT
jgi:PAS domain S-box-containing protein